MRGQPSRQDEYTAGLRRLLWEFDWISPPAFLPRPPRTPKPPDHHAPPTHDAPPTTRVSRPTHHPCITPHAHHAQPRRTRHPAHDGAPRPRAPRRTAHHHAPTAQQTRTAQVQGDIAAEQADSALRRKGPVR